MQKQKRYNETHGRNPTVPDEKRPVEKRWEGEEE